MKTLEYEPLPCVGADLPRKTGTVVQLLKDIPYFLRFRIPTKSVLNSLFRSGISDAGMSGGAKWEPFELSDDEYLDVCRELHADGFIHLDPPEWVRTHSDWHIWQMEMDYGVPAEEHLRLSNICEEINQLLDRAKKNGEIDEMRKFDLARCEAGSNLAEFVQQHLHK